ncbi:MAG: peptidoglycan-binding domain-containing protein [Pseudomonadota bacterium]
MAARTRGALLLTVLGLCIGAQPIAAQDAAAIAADVRAALGLPAEAAAEPADQHAGTVCLPALAPDAPAHSDVTFAVQLDGNGLPAAAAELVQPIAEAADLPHLRQLLRAEAALTTCKEFLTLPGGALLLVQTVGDTVHVAAVEPEPEAQVAATEFEAITDAALPLDEASLRLTRAEMRELQVRLALAGHDPGRADGVFGRRTRAAIAAWQETNQLPVSGYLNAPQRTQLSNETQDAFAAYRADRSVTSRSSRTYIGRDGCLRGRGGQIIQGRSFRCDFRKLMEGPGR